MIRLSLRAFEIWAEMPSPAGTSTSMKTEKPASLSDSRTEPASSGCPVLVKLRKTSCICSQFRSAFVVLQYRREVTWVDTFSAGFRVGQLQVARARKGRERDWPSRDTRRYCSGGPRLTACARTGGREHR